MSATTGSRTGRVRVLVVDDEPGLTALLSAAVADAGRRPHPAPGGPGAQWPGDGLVRPADHVVRPAEAGR
ncbi:hypothetical protein [Streptomyces arenae]|uniref:hypothetical protein n=1 Tax=Streptomyces arenae TaxID=29301 RepID=UPI002659EEBC|nr:hypothetical protein [Streptomyces arenae]MCG7203031.1 hypothetical protein [Streptomyces arenae]